MTKPTGQKRPKPAATAKTTNWDSIALNLGIEPPPEPAKPSDEQPALAKAVETIPSQQPQFSSVTPESGDESPNFFDEKFDFEEPFDLLESAEGKPTSAADLASGQQEDQEATRKSRKRRRRRPRRREDNATDQTRSTAAESLQSEEELPASEGPRRQRDVEAAEAGDRQSERRRRPRRGKHRGDDRQSEGKTPDRLAVKPESGEDEHFHDEHDEFADGELFSEGESQPRTGFRGIPTWDEAVGLLIEKNLAARSKRPADAPRRGQDNRGRQGRQSRHDNHRG
jgi:hypothetical protein